MGQLLGVTTRGCHDSGEINRVGYESSDNHLVFQLVGVSYHLLYKQFGKSRELIQTVSVGHVVYMSICLLM